MAPEFLCELVSIRSQLNSYSECGFSVVTPTLWNGLLADIRNASSLENYKSILKTSVFKVTFTDK